MYVALVIQHAMRMRHIVICGLRGSALFFHVFINGTFFEKIVTEHKMCFGFFTILSETFLILRRIERDIVINVQGEHKDFS
jgi:hypothetical protein